MQSKLVPPVYFVILLFLAIILDNKMPVWDFIKPPYHYIGLIFMFMGSVTSIWSASLFKKYHTTIIPYEKPDFMVISGPFLYSRNPMYLGMTLVLIGVATGLGSLISFSAPIVFFILMNNIFIPMEERNLEEVFGKSYLDYKQRVRCWV